MSNNPNDPTSGDAASGAAIGGQTGVTAPGSAGASASGAPMPWDDQQRQLDAMKANLAQLDQARHAAFDAYNAIKDAPIDDSGYGPAGSVSSQARTQALNAYTSSEQKYAQALSDMGALSTDIATAKQKYAASQKDDPVSTAQAASATAQAGYYTAQAKEAQARTDYLTSPAGVAKDKAAAALDNARAVTEGAQQALYAAQQGETAANAAFINAKAAAYPAESAASVGASNANAAANRAQAAQIQALIAAGMPAAQAAATVAQGKASEAEAALHEEELRQKRLGDLGAFIDSMATAQKAGLITQDEADRQVAAKEQALITGATQFDQQKQADANMTTLVGQALQSGNAVRPDQQYMVGGGPGGDIAAALGGLGIQYTPTQLRPQTMPAYAASLGVTTPASVAAANAAPAYAAGLMGPEVVHTTPQQVMAEMQAAKAVPQPGAGPNAGSGVFDAGSSAASLAPGNVPPGLPPGAAAGGVNNGLLLTAPITGAPNYARLPGT